MLGESLKPGATPPPSELLESLQEYCAAGTPQSPPNRPSQPARRDTAPKAAAEIERQLRAEEAAAGNLGAEIERLIAAIPSWPGGWPC